MTRRIGARDRRLLTPVEIAYWQGRRDALRDFKAQVLTPTPEDSVRQVPHPATYEPRMCDACDSVPASNMVSGDDYGDFFACDEHASPGSRNIAAVVADLKQKLAGRS